MRFTTTPLFYRIRRRKAHGHLPDQRLPRRSRRVHGPNVRPASPLPRARSIPSPTSRLSTSAVTISINDIFGRQTNTPLTPTLETADSFNKSMSKFAKLVSVIRGILKANSVTKQEDLNSRRDDFIRDNLRMETNGAGVIVIDNKYEYTPITQRKRPPSRTTRVCAAGDLRLFRRE